MRRHIPIKGSYNIRDIGGYTTAENGTVRWGKLFRSALLSRIDISDSVEMEKLNLSSICDFRTLDEQKAEPDKWFEIQKLNHYPLPIGHGRIDKFLSFTDADFEEGKGHYLYRANRNYVLSHSEQYKAFFKILLEESNYPILFHCTAGKDRTGFATFLLLSILGVEMKVILEDYLLTNKYLAEFAEKASTRMSDKSGIDKAPLITAFQANESYLNGAIEAIEQNHGTVTDYLEKELGIGEMERQKLKSILLE